LSYTSFRYDDIRLNRSSMTGEDTLRVTVRLSNTGKRFGEEVVQMYIRDDVGSVTRPVMELKGFHKVGLNAGDSREVEFVITQDCLTFTDHAMQHRAEPGTFTIMIGPHSAQVQSRTITLH